MSKNDKSIVLGGMRKLDGSGRLTIPHEFRNALNIGRDDFLTISLDIENKEIVVKRICDVM